jgi:hypothetical protein
MNLNEIGSENVNCIELAQDSILKQNVVNRVMMLFGSITTQNILIV